MRSPRPDLSLTRRCFALSAAAAALALSRRSARAAEPAASGAPRVLVVGDSMIAGGFGLFLARTLAEDHGYRVRRRGKSSTGLARPDFFDWIEEAERLVAEEPADVSVVMFGGNDVQGLYMGKGQWIRWHEPGWTTEYARRINELCAILSPREQPIYWVGLPIMRPGKFQTRVQRVNGIYRDLMGARHYARFIDTWSVLTDAEGAFAERIVLEPPAEGKRPKRVRVRAGDGIHLTPAGAHRLKDYVLEQMLPSMPPAAPPTG